MQSNANFLGNDLMKYDGGAETCIITCSANIHTMGNILNASADVQRILQYSNTELIGHSINHMMPAVIARLHDDFMEAFFERGISERLGRESIVFPVNKEGYIVPCTLTVRIIPNLNEGLKTVGFLNDLNRSRLHEKGGSGLSSNYKV